MRRATELEHQAKTLEQSAKAYRLTINPTIHAGGADPVRLFAALTELEGLAYVARAAAATAKMKETENREP